MRPDISFTVNKLSQFMHRPMQTHWTATKRILRYLKMIIFHGIQIANTGKPVLTTYYDANWAGNVDDCTSTSTYISFLDSTPISWSSKKQRAVARSSTEAEYCALATRHQKQCGSFNYSVSLPFPYHAHLNSYVTTLVLLT
jgi:hypothetical protein